MLREEWIKVRSLGRLSHGTGRYIALRSLQMNPETASQMRVAHVKISQVPS